jgi:UDP-glucose 4-epimerase
MDHVLITGASGFFGRAIVSRLAVAGHTLTLASRRPATIPAATAPAATTPHRHVHVGDLSGSTDWRDALEGCTTVVHLAAQVPGSGVSEERFRIVNDEATAALTRQAAARGVRRFIFISSIFAITGNASDAIVSDSSEPAPTSAYGRSKLAAERHVDAFAERGDRIGISLRPVMGYGADAAGNWRLLQKLAATGLPLPFGAVTNRRSLIGIGNLADAISAVVAKRDDAPNGAFAIADIDPVSLSEMLRLLREGMKQPARLISVPPVMLSGLLHAAGRGTIAQSLLGDLVVDASRFRQTFSWSPPQDIRDGIRRSGADFAPAR